LGAWRLWKGRPRCCTSLLASRRVAEELDRRAREAAIIGLDDHSLVTVDGPRRPV
jgi:hypothetical protein